MKKVTVYTTQSCPYCMRAKQLLNRNKIAFQEVDVTNDAKKRDELECKTNWKSVPMVFIGDDFIGGCDDLYSLHEQGALMGMVNS